MTMTNNSVTEEIKETKEQVPLPLHEVRERDREYDEVQKIVTGRIKETRVGTEVISFYIDLGPFRIVCVANIPADNEKEAPVYVKFMMKKER